MSTHGHTAATQDSHAPGHASVATYVRVALILTVVTALEVGVIYIRFLTPIIVPLLLVMAVAKFALVVMFFMHLRYDPRPLTGLFVGPLIIATLLALALIALVGTLLTLHG
jgi:cytochrome c oxidase subunit IV